ncbi:hypothetical protein ACFU96_27280 [Streptomyces sp. NPDC057620]|uniref:hypothetical protein n=1 Tax=Streptomyces sp. NPDC057620 TaxID=3346185 RepID=UPI00368CCCB5
MLTIVSNAQPDPDPHPRYGDYPTHDAYVEAFHLWRARRRDDRLNDEEHAAVWEVTEAALRSRFTRG